MFKKDTLIMALILGVSIAAVAVIAVLIGGYPTWHGYFLVLLFFLGKCEKKKELLDVFLGGAVGIFWALGCSELTNLLAGALPFAAALGITLIVGIFVLAALNDVCPLVFNNFSFVYYLIGALFTPQQTVEWLVSLVGFGAIFSAMVFGGMYLFLERPAKARAARALEQSEQKEEAAA